MAKEISNEQKRELAKILFTREQLEQKIIAQRVNISEQTISKWANEGNWRDMRRRLLLTKEQELNNLYEQLEYLNKEIKESESKYADTKQADIQRKLTATIRDLETNLGIAEIVESGIRFVKHVQQVGTTVQVVEIIDLWNSFVKASIKQ